MDIQMLKTRLQETRSRGEVKALGRLLDGDVQARCAAEALAESRGLGPVDGLDGRRLVRRLLARSGDAQVRSNPIHRDECFVCLHCQAMVEAGGTVIRDHCPECLRSLHVDRIPGDRGADCGGILDPVDMSLEGGGRIVILYRCRRCGASQRNRAHPADQLPAGLRLPGSPE
jgi:hypothetical protein